MSVPTLIGQLRHVRVGTRAWDCDVMNALGYQAHYFPSMGYRHKVDGRWQSLPSVTTDATDVLRLVRERGLKLMRVEWLGDHYLATVGYGPGALSPPAEGRHAEFAMAVTLALLDHKMGSGR